jgi:hypothetical protein
MGGTAAQAKALKASGIDFFVGYLGTLNTARLQCILDAGLAFMPVTLAGEHFDGAGDEVKQIESLGIPMGVTVWLDLEGHKAFHTPPAELILGVNQWAETIAGAGYQPGLYVGSPQPLTSEELWRLKVTRYWNALSREADRFGQLAEPKCGWCMWQMHPQKVWRDSGVFVDVNIIGADFMNRVPTWCRV